MVCEAWLQLQICSHEDFNGAHLKTPNINGTVGMVPARLPSAVPARAPPLKPNPLQAIDKPTK